MKRLWVAFFMFWPLLAVVVCWFAADMNWWLPRHNGTLGGAEGVTTAFSPIGQRIDDLFHLILIITSVVFVGTHIALGYVVWTGAKNVDEDKKSIFTHGSHNLEVLWTIIPAGILLFIALYQMDTWAEYRVKGTYPEKALRTPIAEITARQFEWRIRYPAPGREFANDAEVDKWLMGPQPGDLYSVNELHVPTNRPVIVHLRSMDVQHSFFVPKLRVKQDAVPGSIIPIKFEVTKPGEYELLCAELCGWGHYKMGAKLIGRSAQEHDAAIEQLKQDQDYDGITQPADPVANQTESTTRVARTN